MFFNSTVTVLRWSAGAYSTDGIWEDGSQTSLTISANVQPLNQRESEQMTHVLEGGNRTALMVKVYTKEQLKLDTQMTGQKADIIVWLGRRYKVAMQEEWQSNVIPHYRYIGVEVDENEFDN